MPRFVKITLRILVAIILLVAVLWIALIVYVQSHKKQVLTYITEQLSEQMDGELEIKAMQPSLWKSFPDISVALSGITLRDSMYATHHYDLVKLKTMYVKLNSLALIRRKAEIRKITFSNGSISIYVDSTGYTNAYVLKGKKKGKPKFSCNNYAFENVTLTMRDDQKKKFFQVMVNEADGIATMEDGIWHANTYLSVKIGSMTFNMEKGSFLKNAAITANLRTEYDPATKVLSVKDQVLYINNKTTGCTARFDFSEQAPPYYVHLSNKKADFGDIGGLLSPSITQKIDSILITRPMEINAWLTGNIKFRDTPEVLVRWHTVSNELKSPIADFTDCSFDGEFYNEVVKGKGHGDPNTKVVLKNVTAKWRKIPLTADSVRVDNLIYPLLTFSLHSHFPLISANVVSSKLPFKFENGRADVNVHYKGGIKTSDTLYPQVQGDIGIDNGTFTYLPRGIRFTDTKLKLLLTGDDLYFTNISIRSPGGMLNMKGYAEHFFRFYFQSPEKVVINWQAESPDVNLAEFLVLVKKRQTKWGPVNPITGKRSTERILSQLDEVLDKSFINLQVIFDKLRYHHFTATHLVATASFSPSAIELKQVNLHHADGTLAFSGHIAQDAAGNPFDLKAKISNVAVNKLFEAFENFGQGAIEAKNIQGRLDAEANVSGSMTEKAKIVARSLDGTVSFSVKNGVLQDFEPLQKIGDLLFRNRDMSHIVFDNIANKLRVNKGKIIIPPMDIASSALYMKVQGIYAQPNNTDIAIQVPLRNPEKDGFDTTGKKYPVIPKKGLTLNLRAQSDDDGKVKIGWDPLKKGLKATDPMFGK